jgi:hypothetical protein
MQDNSHPQVAFLPEQVKATAVQKTNGQLAEISRKWLSDIVPENFSACHEYLAAVRLARHMSKIDVCRASQSDGTPASGVSLPTVSKIESGAYGEPGFRTMIRLARGYGIPMSSLERFFP